MHVGLLLGRLAIGGSERQFAALATGLLARGHRVRFRTLFGGGELGRELEHAGVELEPLCERPPRPATMALPAVGRDLARSLAADPPDVLYAGDYPSNLLAARAAGPTGVPVVWGIRTLGRDLALPLVVFRSLGRRLRSRARLAISNSAAGLALHRELGYLPERALVVPNGVDVERFRPAADAAEVHALRDRHGLDPDRRWVGLVARFDPMKDHATFLRAAALVAARDEDARFLVVAPSVDDVPRRLGALADAPPLRGRLRFLAAGSDPAACYRLLDVLVSSSRAEGFPNAILEAMASGVPAAVTDAGDSAAAAGDTGTVAPPRDPAALAEAVLALLAEPAEARCARSVAARRRAVEVYGLEEMVRRTEAALEDVTSGAREAAGALA
jgi:glycosyltransferase involved in cell wall biosynthesis